MVVAKSFLKSTKLYGQKKVGYNGKKTLLHSEIFSSKWRKENKDFFLIPKENWNVISASMWAAEFIPKVGHPISPPACLKKNYCILDYFISVDCKKYMEKLIQKLASFFCNCRDYGLDPVNCLQCV